MKLPKIITKLRYKLIKRKEKQKEEVQEESAKKNNLS